MSCQMDQDSSSRVDMSDQERDGKGARKCCVKQLGELKLKKKRSFLLFFFYCLICCCFSFISLPFLFVSLLSL